jgi:hypothetical protein
VRAKAGSKGIVWLASYPRSGNTWTRNFLYNLLNLVDGKDRGGHDVNRLQETSLWDIAAVRYEPVLGKKVAHATRAEIAMARPSVQSRIAAEADGPVLVKTHNALVLDRGVPTVNMGVTGGAVYIVRNPLDVAISFAHHFATDIDAAIARMGRDGVETDVNAHAVHEVYGSWSQHVASWTRKAHPAIHVVRYEDMLAAPAETFAALARHLLIAASAAQIAAAVERSSFERSQAQERRKGYRERPIQSQAFFREGRAEQWRDVLSGDQVARIVGDHREQMQRFGYVPDGL